MTCETDIPCLECGSPSDERSIATTTLDVSLPESQTIRIAECPDCGARHFAESALRVLGSASQETEPAVYDITP